MNPSRTDMNEAESDNRRTFGAFLRRVHRRGLLLVTLESTMRFLSVEMFLLVFAGIALSMIAGLAVGFVFRFLFLFLSIALFYRLVLRPLSTVYTLQKAVVRLSEASGVSRSDIRSALEFLGRSTRGSRSLREAHIESIARRTGRVNPPSLFPSRPVLHAGALFIGVLAAILALTMRYPLVANSVRFFFQGGLITGEATLGKALLFPVASDIRVYLHFPDYMKRESRYIEGWSGGLSLPRGTLVEVDAEKSDMGRLVLSLPQGEVAMTASQDRVRGSFVFEKPGRGRFEVRGPKGNVVASEAWRPLEVEEDRAPSVRMLSPSKNVEMDKGGEVAIEYEASDDFGLDQLEFVYKPEGMEPKRKVIRKLAGAKTAKGKWVWSLAEFGWGDEEVGRVLFGVEAVDNNLLNGPSRGSSATRWLTVLTPSVQHKNALDSLRVARDTMVDLLAMKLESLESRKPAAQRESSTPDLPEAKTEEALTRLGDAIWSLSNDPLASRRIREDVSALRQRLGELSFELGKNAGDLSTGRRFLAFLESAILRVDDILGGEERALLTWKGKRIEENRSRLERLLGDYLRSRSENTRQRILGLLEDTERKIKELLAAMAGIDREASFEHLNIDDLLEQDPLRSIARIRELLASGDAEEAARLITRFGESIGSILSGMENYLRRIDGTLLSSEDKGISQLLDRAADLESYQRQLARQTTAMVRRYQDRLTQILKGRMDRIVSKHLKSLEGVDSLWKEKEPEGFVASYPSDIARVEQIRGFLIDALKQGDLDEAFVLAKEASELLKSLADRSENPQGLLEAAKRFTQVAAGLGSVLPLPRELLSREDRAQLKPLAKRQREILFHARKLRQTAVGQADEVPFLSAKASRWIDSAASSMEHAAELLEGGLPREGLSAENAALGSLSRLREDVLNIDQAAPLPQTVIANDSDIDIPAPDEFEVPREFRGDILEAMRSPAPAEYRDEIAEYYLELVH